MDKIISLMQKAIVLFLALTLIACTPTAKNKSADNNNPPPSDTFKASLSEMQLEESLYSILKSRFYISLPKNYAIEPMYGEDFTVYYFHPADTALKNALTGGIYFGNHPSFHSGKEKTETRKAPILGKTRKWEITLGDSVYNVQTVFEQSRIGKWYDDGWQVYIHAFGQAQSQAEIDQLLSIFATLRKEE
ncbi:hypothetical protein FACS189464_2190 [Bacteroidia bacterium]|nr:hypothetical protein FACS189464_2190 [Bacteroidia bacterium]